MSDDRAMNYITVHLEDGTEIEVPVDKYGMAATLAKIEQEIVYSGEILRVRLDSGYASILTDRIMHLTYDLA